MDDLKDNESKNIEYIFPVENLETIETLKKIKKIVESH